MTFNPLIRLFFLLLVGLALGTFSGCGGPPPAPLSAPQDIPGYHQLRETFGTRDFLPLKGRRIVVDPGHGGFFRGAVGPEGLTEAEVNLGVALYLRGLLEWAGAEVFLTRTADYDFLSPEDSLLSTDLAFRVDFANQRQPDVFLSIHHNSTASADPTINETQTYYPLGAEGAALDLARSIHRQLVLKLEISPASILPGNFHVLRHAQVPAVLGEPAMISNPVMEGRLSLAASHELEAQAYFLGLLDYFAGGSPTWRPSQPDTLSLAAGASPAVLHWEFAPGLDEHAPGPDPQSIVLTLDGDPQLVHISPDGYQVSWRPGLRRPLSHPATLTLTGKNLAGRSTPPRNTHLLPALHSRPSWRVSRETADHSVQPHQLVSLRSVEASTLHRQWALMPAQGDDPLEQGRAFLTQISKVDLVGGVLAEPPAPGHSWRLLTLRGSRPDVTDWIPPGGWQDRRQFGEGHPDFPGPAPMLAVAAREPVWIEARGVLPLVDPAPGVPDTARTVDATGRFWQTETLVPSLLGAVIVLDPAGGGPDSEGRGPLGLRGSELNLAVAQATRELLEGAGATVHLTRQGEVAPFPHDKVRLAEQVGAQLFLTIGRSDQIDRLSLRHHPGSVTGQKWALAQQQALAPWNVGESGLTSVIEESYGYLLRHTACPALEVRLPGLFSVDRELQAATLAYSQREARALLLGCAAALGEERVLDQPLNLPRLMASLPPDKALAEVDWVLVDGNFFWPDPSSSFLDTGLDSLSLNEQAYEGYPGLPHLVPWHTLELHQGKEWQLWFVDQAPGQQPRLMLEGPLK
nr:N-acetylmuramoyl-L-alanine amidase [Candidatus Krumholzibacteria bacterium]